MYYKQQLKYFELNILNIFERFSHFGFTLVSVARLCRTFVMFFSKSS